jgi:hypothetical protein
MAEQVLPHSYGPIVAQERANVKQNMEFHNQTLPHPQINRAEGN